MEDVNLLIALKMNVAGMEDYDKSVPLGPSPRAFHRMRTFEINLLSMSAPCPMELTALCSLASPSNHWIKGKTRPAVGAKES